MIKIHHLSCGSFCPLGGCLLGRSSKMVNQRRLRELVARSSKEITVFCAHDADEFAKLST